MMVVVRPRGWPHKAIFDTERSSGFEGLWNLGKKLETNCASESENLSTGFSFLCSLLAGC